jgi:hypothetical protein
MAGVVNVLTFREPVDRELFKAAELELVPRMREVDGFVDLYVVQTSETEVILVILGDTVETLDRLATEIGSPWMTANVVPMLAGPPQRHVGPVIASSDERAAG